ncbi:MAG TPA: cupredoxin domain-containing protein [Steroidobacteraceae bacterium]|nr:cupredoxin domain-containing protein [Steroidobacteraceae bacterium]
MNFSSRGFRPILTLAAMSIAVVCATALVPGSRAAVAEAAAPAPAPAAAAAAVSTMQSDITIDSYMFRPAVVTIAKGTTVVWVNKDDDVHTIKSKAGPEAFSSPALPTGSRYGFTFKRAGTYRYICSVHPYMHGVIVVR